MTTTFTEIVAAVVLHSSAVALSHFGVTMEPTPQVEPAAPPAAERVIARTPTQQHRSVKLTSCPERAHRLQALKA